MRNLTRVLMIFLVTLFYYQLNAQTFGIKGGLNLASMPDKNDDEIHSSMNPRFHLGVTLDVPFSDFLSFEPGLILTTKGKKYDYMGMMGREVNAKVNLYYLDVPLPIKVSQDLGEGLKMFGTIGPYVGLGLSGKGKGSDEYQGEKGYEYEFDVAWGSDEGDGWWYVLKRLDLGLTFGAGVEINPIILGISFDLGLSNISAYQDNGTSLKNRVLKFSVGYRF